MDETILSLSSSLFHPDWKESEAQLTKKQTVLLMHDIYSEEALQKSYSYRFHYTQCLSNLL